MIYTSLMIFFLSLLPEKIPMGDSRAGFAGNFRSECDTAEQEKGELRHIQFEFFKTFSSPLFFIMCSRVSIRCPAAPVAVLYLPFCRCPRSCAPAGDHPTPYPRASAPLLSVPLSRSRRGPPAVRPSPSLPRKILPGIPERIFREQSSVHTVLAPLLLWFWWPLRRNVTALRPTDSVPNQSARVCRLRR